MFVTIDPGQISSGATKSALERQKNEIDDIPRKSMFFCTIYIAPHNYHRFHSPADWNVHLLRHFSGDLYTVSPKHMPFVLNKFITHERIALIGEWKYGMFSMIPVGSTNVGSINIKFDKASERTSHLC